MKKKIIFTLIVLGGLFCFFKMAEMFSPGSYPFAERYELAYPEVKVIEAINRLKHSNKDLVVPKVTIENTGHFDLKDGRDGETDYWYNVYFSDKDKNQILFTWTRPSGPYSSTFAFVSINDGLDLGHWNEINANFGFFENRKIKREFEETILKKIKHELKSK